MTTTLEIKNGVILLPTKLHQKFEKRKVALNINGNSINIDVLPLSYKSPNDRLKIWQSALEKIRSGWDREI